ncbi:hypothetical protein [Desulfurococcus mucosus]|uniref:Uncharacterized protein n=1 Tax=Desulfurococcus mucosus (strain ATCC 35584 / DSM 2162 / JCM 9187 / O7/1) TaxID=765177 RepID=E8R962_DESM0|nr:hypothetical protein [Desulfurococcus mucosus]ADV65038.1 hypothetical protein Desmu_0732 [Desulfurococcus mucosus DSM 2162]
MEPYIPASVFSNATTASRMLESRGCTIVFLNDLAVNLYGLVIPIAEVRVLLPEHCADEALGTLLESFGIHEDYLKAGERLSEKGLVAVSTRTRPLLVAETAKTSLDNQILGSPVKYLDAPYEFNIPVLEHLIVKLLAMGLYPYSAYGASLLFSWLDHLNPNVWAEAVEGSGLPREALKDMLRSVSTHIGNFQPAGIDGLRDKLKALLDMI